MKQLLPCKNIEATSKINTKLVGCATNIYVNHLYKMYDIEQLENYTGCTQLMVTISKNSTVLCLEIFLFGLFYGIAKYSWFFSFLINTFQNNQAENYHLFSGQTESFDFPAK